MAKVLITGGTGMIGGSLIQLLDECGHEVHLLTRNPSSDARHPQFKWDIENGTMDPKALDGVDTIMHLAGAGIADKPWTDDRKKEILDSRVKSADLLRKTCEVEGVKLKNFVSASAIGWYPLIVDDLLYTEDSPRGKGFLADVCQAWEEAADRFEDIADHISKIRIGLVLAREGGALKQIELPVRLYVGAALGRGKQAMSWIHIWDVCRIFEHAMVKNLDGAYNAVGPELVTNEDFMQNLADVIEKPMFFPNVPDFVIKTLFGEKADLILKGVQLSAKKIQGTGFTFDFPTLNSALMRIYPD